MIIAILLGLTLGSFGNVLILHLTKNYLNLWNRSQCLNCNHFLSWCELIPLLSWFLQKGRCRYCSHSISTLYPLVEGCVTLWFVYCSTLSYSFLMTFLWAIIGYLFILILIIDIREKIIPDSLIIALLLTLIAFEIESHESLFLIFMTPFVTLWLQLALK